MLQTKSDLYKEYSESEIFLEEENHIYIHKKTGKFYNSVTGIISLFKEEFDEKDTVSGLIRQYQTFHNWYFQLQNGDPSNFIDALTKYVNFRQFTDKEMTVWNGKECPRYVRKITDYATIAEFITEYQYLEAVYSPKIKRPKNIYLDVNMGILKSEAILQMWQDMTDIANHYGNMVHLTLERYILKKQGLVFDNILLEQISNHFIWIKNNIIKFYEKYPFSRHSFEEYELDLSLVDLMADIEHQFEIHKIDLGICTVPERRLLYNNLCGTKDVDTHLDSYLFNTGDHKTNKDFNITSPFNTKMKAPFNSYEDSHYTHYNIQLSTYSFMQEKSTNKKLNNQYITYYNRKKGIFEIFEMKYLKDEAEYLTNYYNKWIEERKRRYLNSSLGPLIKNIIKPEWLDHFAKSFYYCIAEYKDNKDKKFFKDYIVNYAEKHKNIKIC